MGPERGARCPRFALTLPKLYRPDGRDSSAWHGHDDNPSRSRVLSEHAIAGAGEPQSAKGVRVVMRAPGGARRRSRLASCQAGTGAAGHAAPAPRRRAGSGAANCYTTRWQMMTPRRGASFRQRATSWGAAAVMAARRGPGGSWLIGWSTASMSQNPSPWSRRSTAGLSARSSPDGRRIGPGRPHGTGCQSVGWGHRRTAASRSRGRVGTRRSTRPRADRAGTAPGAAHTWPSHSRLLPLWVAAGAVGASHDPRPVDAGSAMPTRL